MPSKSYRAKTFVIDDPDARVRRSADLMQFDRLPNGGLNIIPKGTQIRVLNAKVANDIVFVQFESTDTDPIKYGWTSSINLAGKFVNETLGQVAPSGNSKKGPNAAWERGRYIGQVTLVEIVDYRNGVEQITLDGLPAYEGLIEAAASDGVTIKLRSGFRSYPEQQQLYNAYRAGRGNKAAPPGASNHQHGQAFDLHVSGYDGDPIYDWLAANGPGLGFIRTVNREPWHWEFRPADAERLASRGRHKAAGVTR